jgi:hypothetical protein
MCAGRKGGNRCGEARGEDGCDADGLTPMGWMLQLMMMMMMMMMMTTTTMMMIMMVS